MDKNYPKWYIQAVKNKPFYESGEYYMLLEDGISEYNKALKNNDLQAVEKWKSYVLKCLFSKETNRLMLMQI